MLKLLVFDLDGTLVDTAADLANAVNHALRVSDRKPLPLASVVAFIGDGARNLIERSLKATANGATPSAADIESALADFLSFYKDNCLIETKTIAGVESCLEKLPGYRKAVLTNKPEAPSYRILSGLNLRDEFAQVIGGDNPWGQKPDPTALLHLCESMQVNPKETVMIGDGIQDLRVARRAGTRFIGYLGGFGSRETFLTEKPETVIETMADLPAALSALDAIDQHPVPKEGTRR